MILNYQNIPVLSKSFFFSYKYNLKLIMFQQGTEILYLRIKKIWSLDL